jgi:hypothetical protein
MGDGKTKDYGKEGAQIIKICKKKFGVSSRDAFDVLKPGVCQDDIGREMCIMIALCWHAAKYPYSTSDEVSVGVIFF